MRVSACGLTCRRCAGHEVSGLALRLPGVRPGISRFGLPALRRVRALPELPRGDRQEEAGGKAEEDMSGNNPGLDVWRATEGLFDRPFRVALAEPTIEIEEGQEICPACFLVFWTARGACPHCEAGADNYPALAAAAEATRRGYTKADYALAA